MTQSSGPQGPSVSEWQAWQKALASREVDEETRVSWLQAGSELWQWVGGYREAMPPAAYLLCYQMGYAYGQETQGYTDSIVAEFRRVMVRVAAGELAEHGRALIPPASPDIIAWVEDEYGAGHTSADLVRALNARGHSGQQIVDWALNRAARGLPLLTAATATTTTTAVAGTGADIPGVSSGPGDMPKGGFLSKVMTRGEAQEAGLDPGPAEYYDDPSDTYSFTAWDRGLPGGEVVVVITDEGLDCSNKLVIGPPDKFDIVASFRSANLRGSYFANINFHRSTFEDADFTTAVFRNVMIGDGTLGNVTLASTSFNDMTISWEGLENLDFTRVVATTVRLIDRLSVFKELTHETNEEPLVLDVNWVLKNSKMVALEANVVGLFPIKVFKKPVPNELLSQKLGARAYGVITGREDPFDPGYVEVGPDERFIPSLSHHDTFIFGRRSHYLAVGWTSAGFFDRDAPIRDIVGFRYIYPDLPPWVPEIRVPGS